MPEGPHEDHRQRLRDEHGQEGDLHGRADLLARVEPRRQDLDEDQRGQPDAVAQQRPARLPDVVDAELPVLVERRDQRHREQPQRDRRRQREQQREPQPPVEQRRVLGGIVVAVVPGEARQQHGAECHAQQSARELHQAVGIGDPRDPAVAQQRGELRVDERRNLRRRHAEDRRAHQQQHAPHALVAPVEARARQHPDARERRDLERELRDAPDGHTPRQREDRRVEEAREEQRGADDRQVEQHRRERRDREAPVDVEHAAGQRHQRHEQDVGEDDADHLRGELDLARRAREAAGEQIHEPRRGQHARDRHAEQQDGEQRADAADQVARRVLAALPVVFAEDRHERLREGPLREHPAQDVGQPERRLERVHLQPGAEDRRLEAFADEPGDPRQQRHPADGGQGAKEVQGAGTGMAGGAAPRAGGGKPLSGQRNRVIITG